MPQADGTHSLSRFSLDIPGYGTYRFKVNPENYTHSMPQRTTTVKTKSDIIVEDYGKDIETITFSGTTGFRGSVSGKSKIDELQASIAQYARQADSGNTQTSSMIFHNWTDDKHYKVHLSPQALQISRSVNEALLYRYELSLVVLGDASEPDRDVLAETELGNRNPSIKQDIANRVAGLTPQQQQARKKNTEKLINNSANTKANTTTRKNATKQVARTTGAGRGGRDFDLITNPRTNTTGVTDVINNLALIVGYGNGGLDL